MTNKVMLKKLIEIAIQNGCEQAAIYWDDLQEEFDGYDLEWTLKNGPNRSTWFLFEHEFTKAIFGEQAVCPNCGDEKCDCGELVPVARWTCIIKDLAITSSRDRIKYAYDNRITPPKETP